MSLPSGLQDLPEERAYKENNPRWQFTLRSFKTSISPVIAAPQQVWQLGYNSFLDVEEDKEGNPVSE